MMAAFRPRGFGGRPLRLMDSYLQQLTQRLTRGLASRPPEFRQRHIHYVQSMQNADGGWSGREGGSDLYYTSFAVRSLACVAGLSPPVVDRLCGFLRNRLQQPASVVDFMALLYTARLIHAADGRDVLSVNGTDWPVRVADALDSFRRPDGGYAKSTESKSAGSTYHTFLVAMCYELIGLPLPDPHRIIDFLSSRRREDGGFVEVSPARRGGTNPTAAAVALLRMLGAMTSEFQSGVVQFLVGMQSADGGLRANDRAPLSDLLSSFTGVLTLVDLGASNRLNLQSLHQFVESTESPSGGYRGGQWDHATDAEYTFYGLGTVALINAG